ncbi:glycolipid transfer protein domain-containing protein [Chaetomium sp. MPI-SDFR-AT-0129]|nr:glycolipid transfer protein domain-containing protein [Chaetomium sp. MPI-SDFR-AT-0129]
MAAIAVVPEDGTYLDTFKGSFTRVPIDAEKDNAIATTEFLEASESLTTMFDLLGSVAFSPVKKDLLGNIEKVRKRQLAAPLESENLQDLVRNELKSKSHTATEGLLWLVRRVALHPQPSKLQPEDPIALERRKSHTTLTLSLPLSGLEFTCIALSQNLANHKHELADSFRDAYGKTLKPHHSFIIKPIFSAAMGACPYRKDFYGKLGTDEAKVHEELDLYLKALDKIVGILKGFLETKEAKW